jgi:intein/homing endonuclease
MSYIFKCPLISGVQLNRCLALDSKVLRDDGLCDIGDLKVGDNIMGRDGYVEVRHVFPVEHKDVYEIETKSGKKIICSREHLFPTENGAMSIADGLTVGDSLFTAKQI